MEYWKGIMNWPLNKDWLCETCGENKGLIWGMVHARCRCIQCHTEYTMRNYDEENHPRVEIPICMLKEEYKKPAKSGWERFGTPITAWDDKTWDDLLKEPQ